MAKAKKEPPPKPKKKGKYDITLKPTMTADELFKLAINTPLPKRDKKK